MQYRAHKSYNRLLLHLIKFNFENTTSLLTNLLCLFCISFVYKLLTVKSTLPYQTTNTAVKHNNYLFVLSKQDYFPL